MELNLTVNIKDKPYGIGVGIGGSSDAEWSASSDGGAGFEIGNTSEKANLHGKGKIKAFGNWMNSITGKIYVASGDGKGLGYDGKVRGDVGAGISAEVNEQAVADDKGFLGIGGKIKGSLDREGHARVDGNIHSYTSEELKEIVTAKSSGGRRIKFGFKRTKGNTKDGNKSSKEAIEEKVDICVDNKSGEECKSDELIVEKNNEQDLSIKCVDENDENASDEDCDEEKTVVKSKDKENTKEQFSDEGVDHRHGDEDASDEGNDKEIKQEVVSDTD